MKQQLEIVIVTAYNDKILLNYDSHCKKYSLPIIDKVFRSSPEELISSYFQKKYKVVLDPAVIIDVCELDGSEQFYLVYKNELSAEQYSTIVAQTGLAKWFNQSKIKNGVGIDDVSKRVLQKNATKIFNISRSSNLIFDRNKYVLYTDGGSRGNPGHSGVGYAICDMSGSLIQQGGDYIGIAVSAVAEYHALLRGLEAALILGIRDLEVRVDNLMIAKQMNGLYQVRNRELWPIYERIVKLAAQFDKLKFVHIKREFNQIADQLVNQVLDDYLTNVQK